MSWFSTHPPIEARVARLRDQFSVHHVTNDDLEPDGLIFAIKVT